MSELKLEELPSWDLQGHSPEITCVKCDYTRKPSDTAPIWQCPQCGVAYAKSQAAAEEAKARREARRAARDDDEEDLRKKPEPQSNPKTKIAVVIGILVIGGLVWQWNHKRNLAREKQAQQEAAQRLEQIDSAKQQLVNDVEIIKLYNANSLEPLAAHAAQGSTLAMVALGHVNLRQHKTEEAISWFQKAADAGNGIAMVNLGVIYESPYGNNKQPDAAVAWYQRAARQGQAAGLYSLGLMVEKGIGVNQDARRAYMLYELASRAHEEALEAARARQEQGDPMNQFLPYDHSGGSAAYHQKTLGATLSPVDIVKAKEMADAWKPGLPLP